MATRRTQATSHETNLLNDLHSSMANMLSTLRDKICEGCGWHVSTYNSKRRDKSKKGKSYSEAEKLIMMTAYLQTLQIAFDQVEKYKNI